MKEKEEILTLFFCSTLLTDIVCFFFVALEYFSFRLFQRLHLLESATYEVKKQKNRLRLLKDEKRRRLVISSELREKFRKMIFFLPSFQREIYSSVNVKGVIFLKRWKKKYSSHKKKVINIFDAFRRKCLSCDGTKNDRINYFQTTVCFRRNWLLFGKKKKRQNEEESAQEKRSDGDFLKSQLRYRRCVSEIERMSSLKMAQNNRCFTFRESKYSFRTIQFSWHSL